MNHTSFKKILSEYSEYLQEEKQLRPSSVKLYLEAIRGLVAVLSNRPEALLIPIEWQWQDVDKRALEMYLNTLTKERDWRPNTQALQATALRTFFGWLARQGLLERSPARNIKPHVPRGTPSVPEGGEETVQRLFPGAANNLDEARRQAVLELLYGGLLRPGLVYQASEINISKDGAGIDLTSGGETLAVSLSKHGIARIVSYLRMRKALSEVPAGDTEGGEAPLWLDSRGRTCRPPRLAREVKRAMEAAGLTGSGHDLRLLAARHFRERGGDLRTLRHLLGAKRLGELDRYGQMDFQTVANQLRSIHPRQAATPKDQARTPDDTPGDTSE